MKKPRIAPGVATALIAAVALVGLLGAAHAQAAATKPAAAAPTPTVTIGSWSFTPAVVEVPAGTTVTWTNEDEDPHTVTSVTGAFGSAGLSYEETFTQTFTTPGVYEYFCKVHPHMRATVIVR